MDMGINSGLGAVKPVVFITRLGGRIFENTQTARYKVVGNIRHGHGDRQKDGGIMIP